LEAPETGNCNFIIIYNGRQFCGAKKFDLARREEYLSTSSLTQRFKSMGVGYLAKGL
jgi:hypothetical protein